MKFKVGQQVYLVTKWNADVFQSHYSEITKVGRKFAYVFWHDREAKVDLKSREIIVPKYGVVGQCFNDMDDYDNYKKATKIQTFLMEDLIRRTRGKQIMSLEQLKKIEDIFKEE